MLTSDDIILKTWVVEEGAVLTLTHMLTDRLVLVREFEGCSIKFGKVTN